MKLNLTHTSTLIVEHCHTALALGSGDLEVVATPAMVALMENAALKAVENHLPEGSTTVGSQIETTHLRPSPVGATLSATATLTAIDGRKLTFHIEAADEKGIVGQGTHTRFIVDRQKFLAKLSQ